MGRSLESSRPILNAVSRTPSNLCEKSQLAIFYLHFSTFLIRKQTPLSSNRASNRFSTYSGAPSLASTGSSLDPRSAEIKNWSQSFERLEDKRLSQQRYVPSAQKDGDMSKLALGAKVERALGRRMSGQDAVYRPRSKVVSEKVV